jgi:neurofibromin 1
MKRFPEAKFTAVGAFIFLRFFCPAIVAPDAEGLIASAPSKEMRRGLLLIAKVVQNLANNVLFGAKEPYMFPLNDFLTQNIYRVTTFLREISVCFSFIVSAFALCLSNGDRFHRTSTSPISNLSHLISVLVLHFTDFFTITGTTFGKRLSFARERVTFAPLSKLLIAKFRSWRPFASLLLTLVPRRWMSPGIDQLFHRIAHLLIRASSISCSGMLVETQNLWSQHVPYMMVVKARYAYLISLKSFSNMYQDGLPMICIILRNIDTESADYELLLFGYLKVSSHWNTDSMTPLILIDRKPNVASAIWYSDRCHMLQWPK